MNHCVNNVVILTHVITGYVTAITSIGGAFVWSFANMVPCKREVIKMTAFRIKIGFYNITVHQVYCQLFLQQLKFIELRFQNEQPIDQRHHYLHR